MTQRLSEAERARIAATIAAAERRTSAEFAVVVAQTSGDYRIYPLLWTAVAALLAGAVVAIAVRGLAPVTWLAIEVAAGVIAGAILHLPGTRRWIVPGALQRSEAGAAARLHFADAVAGRTEDHGGVLLFVSLEERFVEILADRAVAVHVGDAAWAAVVATFVATTRQGKVADALVAAVDGCTAILAPHFPARPDQRNELPDQVREV